MFWKTLSSTRFRCAMIVVSQCHRETVNVWQGASDSHGPNPGDAIRASHLASHELRRGRVGTPADVVCQPMTAPALPFHLGGVIACLKNSPTASLLLVLLLNVHKIDNFFMRMEHSTITGHALVKMVLLCEFSCPHLGDAHKPGLCCRTRSASPDSVSPFSPRGKAKFLGLIAVSGILEAQTNLAIFFESHSCSL